MENDNRQHVENVKDVKREFNVKKLHAAVTVTAIMSFLAILALVMLYMALADIAKGGGDLRLEWFVVGLAFFIFAVFIISVAVTIFLLLPMPGFFGKKKE
ncbi:MAG TPA: hypothetical protein PK496_06885 [Bacteroidales bacterium]|nr:hypothetical protein [Bacteroidales bacterium]